MSFIQKAIARDIPVVGICLGAQLVGLAEGAATEKSPQPEIGHFPIQLTEHAKGDANFKDFPDSLEVMHWHFDMPGLSKNAVVLAKSAGCPRQIIRYKHNVYGLQCHLELTQKTTQAIIDSCPEQLVPGQYIQPTKQFLAADFATPNHYMNAFLKRLLGFGLRGEHDMTAKDPKSTDALETQVTLVSVLTCPKCAHKKTENMPTNACQWFYECEQCHTLLKPKPGDCCVYCSYGSVKCPSKQNK